MDTLPSGEIDYKDLRKHLLANKDKPAILNVNSGTTVKGAVDDIDKVGPLSVWVWVGARVLERVWVWVWVFVLPKLFGS